MTLATDPKLGLARTLFSRTLHTYFLMRRGLTLGVRAIVRSDDGDFLLVRHTYTPGWHFPGGGVEKGETTEQALSNELLQETSLVIVGKPVLYGAFHNNGVSQRDHVLVYLCEARGTLPAKPPSAEIAELGYFSIDELPDGIDPGTCRRIHEILSHTAPEATW